MRRTICYIEVVVIAVLAAVLASCARPPMVDEVYTPLRAVDLCFPPDVSCVSVGQRDGMTVHYVFNSDSLLTHYVKVNVAEQVVECYSLDYRDGRLRTVEDRHGDRLIAAYELVGTVERLSSLQGETILRRYCYNAERVLQLDTIKEYKIVDGEVDAEPYRRVDFTRVADDHHLTGMWERDFTNNTVVFTGFAADGRTPNLRKHYVAGKIQGKKSGNTVYHSGQYVDAATGWTYYTMLTERAGTSRKGSIVDTRKRVFTSRSEAMPQAVVNALEAADVDVAVASSGFAPDFSSITSSRQTIIVAIAFLLIFALLAWLLIKYANRKWGLLRHFGGPWVPYGQMRRMWMFNWQPYVKMASITGLIILAFALTVAVFQLLGYGVAGLIWVAKAASYIILLPAALTLVGWVVVAFLYLISATVRTLIHKYLLWLFKLSPIIVLAGLLVAYEDEVREYGDMVSQWCTTVLSGMTLQGLMAHWRVVLLLLLSPVLVFLVIALATVLLTGILWATEWVVMRVYRVHVRCPHCNSEEFDYIVHGHKYPVPLHPGVYGVFHHDYEDISVPTMLALGKGRLTRQCCRCGNRTTVSKDRHVVGTDVHIGIAGGPSTGKSWLIYEGLYQLITRHGRTCREHNPAHGESIGAYHRIIESGGQIQTQAGRYTRAVQVMIERKNQPMPWHTHWWDVAGENFDTASNPTLMSFYRQVRCIALLVDPMLTEPGLGASERYKRWTGQQRLFSARYNVSSTMAHLDNIIQRCGGSTRDIHLVIVLAKADQGYLSSVAGIADFANAGSDVLERFVVDDMGLANEVMVARNQYRSVTFAAVSVTTSSKASLRNLIGLLLSRVGIDVN